MPWSDYATRMIDGFTDFNVAAQNDSSLVLSRRRDGDVYRLEFHIEPGEHGLVHVIFSASAG